MVSIELQEIRHRLLSLAVDIDPVGRSDEAALRRTAGELESVVRRIHWLADISTDRERQVAP